MCVFFYYFFFGYFLSSHQFDIFFLCAVKIHFFLHSTVHRDRCLKATHTYISYKINNLRRVAESCSHTTQPLVSRVPDSKLFANLYHIYEEVNNLIFTKSATHSCNQSWTHALERFTLFVNSFLNWLKTPKVFCPELDLNLQVLWGLQILWVLDGCRYHGSTGAMPIWCLTHRILLSWAITKTVWSTRLLNLLR